MPVQDLKKLLEKIHLRLVEAATVVSMLPVARAISGSRV